TDSGPTPSEVRPATQAPALAVRPDDGATPPEGGARGVRAAIPDARLLRDLPDPAELLRAVPLTVALGRFRPDHNQDPRLRQLSADPELRRHIRPADSREHAGVRFPRGVPRRHRLPCGRSVHRTPRVPGILEVP